MDTEKLSTGPVKLGHEVLSFMPRYEQAFVNRRRLGTVPRHVFSTLLVYVVSREEIYWL